MGPPGSALKLSECGQDFWVLDKLGYRDNGTFVDLGAADGITGSNTFILEKFYKWNGVCVEPNPAFIKSLYGSRDVAISDLCAYNESGKILPFLYSPSKEFYGWNFRAGIKGIIEDPGEDCIQHNVFTITLNDIFELYQLPRQIEYISLDVEGCEYPILSAFNFEKYDVSCFTIEYYDQKERKLISELMLSKGYSLETNQFTAQEDWFFK